MERNLSKLMTAKRLVPDNQRVGKIRILEKKEGQTKGLKKNSDKTVNEQIGLPPLDKPFKTAIISSTNTTKSLSLAERPVRQKKPLPKVDKVKKIRQRFKPAMSTRTKSQCSRESYSTGYDSTDFAASVQRNLQQVTELGTEFYEIIETRLKTNVKKEGSFTDDELPTVDGASSGSEQEDNSMSVVVTKKIIDDARFGAFPDRNGELVEPTGKQSTEMKEADSSNNDEVFALPKIISPLPYTEHIGEKISESIASDLEKEGITSESHAAEMQPDICSENTEENDTKQNRMENVQSDQETKKDQAGMEMTASVSVAISKKTDKAEEARTTGNELNTSTAETQSPVISVKVNSPSPVPLSESQVHIENTTDGSRGKSVLDISPIQITALATPYQERNKSSNLGRSETSSDTKTFPSELPEENTSTLTIDEARKIMGIPLEVSLKDVMYVEGEPSVPQLKVNTPPVNSKAYVSKELPFGSLAKRHSFLSSWESSCNQPTKTHKESIHHFCAVQPIVELPWHLKTASRVGHTPDKYLIMDTRMAKQHQTKPLDLLSNMLWSKTLPTVPTSSRFSVEEEEEEQEEEGKDDLGIEDQVRMRKLAEKILSEVEEQETAATESEIDNRRRLKIFMKLQEIINSLFDGDDVETLRVHGQAMELRNDETRFFWTPAPPKLDLPPEVISEKLFPEYHGLKAMSNDLDVPFDDNGNQSAESETEEETAYIEWLKLTERTLNRRHHSVADVNDFVGTKDQLPRLLPNPIDSHDVEDRGDMRARPENGNRTIDSREGEKTEATEKGDMIAGQRRRAASMIDLLDSECEPVYQSDYDTAVREVEYHSEKLNQARIERMRRQLAELETNAEPRTASPAIKEARIDQTTEERLVIPDSATTRSSPGGHSFPADNDSCYHRYSRQISAYSQGTSLSAEVHSGSVSRRSTIRSRAGFSGAVKKCSRKLSKRRKTVKLPNPAERQRLIQEFIAQPARPISRSKSLESMHTTGALVKENLHKKLSLPGVSDTSHLLAGKSADYRWGDNEYLKEEYWYKWMDELYSPSLDGDNRAAAGKGDKVQEISAIDDDVWEQSDEIEVSSDEENRDVHESLRQEIERLTRIIESEEHGGRLAFYICRRGACHRKLGELKKSKEDLDRAIEIEPQLLDAYWHRHLLYLAMDNTKKAVADLDFIVKKTQTHSRAFRSLCDIYKRQGDINGAITNITKAIRLEPAKVDLYYQRAEYFEERGDTLLALDDYKTANALMPSRTTGIYKIGMHHFNTRMWNSAVTDFTEQLKQEPKNSEVYLHRGISFLRLNQFLNALKDFSTAIQCNPSSAQAFFYRGCVLRKGYPARALQDLSVSLMLDSTVSNISAYLHRGILYAELSKWSQAMFDFVQALKLDRNLPEAHVNLGVIYLQVFNNSVMAVRRFNSAIRVDPSYVRAFVCRGEAYKATGNLKFAIRDFARAVHLHPNVMDYKITMGQLLLSQNNLGLAGRIIRQCAAMEKSYLTFPSQQAAVQTFLKNFKEGIDILQTALKSKRDPALLVQLGKIKMKAKNWREAKDDFEKAIEMMRAPFTKELPKKAAFVYFLIGLCHMELFSPSNAIDAFNTATQLDNEYAEAYYQRGLAKMKLRNMKAILDFNKALAYNPRFFQAFISRAAFYGLKGRFAKAIMNCNEAISLQPGSVKAFLYRGSLKYHIKAFRLAVKDLSKAIQMSPACDLAYYNRAVCYQKMKHYQRALKDYSIVMMLEKKDNLRVLVNRGLLYLEIGDYSNALLDFYASVEIDKKNPKVYHTLGICYRRLGRVKESLLAYTKAIEIDKFFVDGFIGRGNVLVDLGTPEGHNLGRRDFVRALHINPKCMLARINLAYSLQIRGKFKAAWLQFTRAIDVDDRFRAAYEGRSIVNLQMSNFFAALLDINSALKIEKTAELLTNRGVINQFMGDPVNAMRDYQEALKIDPSYPLAYYNAANVYFLNRQFSQAFEYYSKAIDWNQRDESALHNRAITRVMLRDTKGAFQDFGRAVELSPNTPHLYFNRANIYASLGRYQEAEEDYTKAIALQPTDAILYRRRAEVLGRLSRRSEALKDYQMAIKLQTEARK